MATCVRCGIFDLDCDDTKYCEGCTYDIIRWLHEADSPQWVEPTDAEIDAMVERFQAQFGIY